MGAPDWLPTKREEIVAMAEGWVAAFKTQKGKLLWKIDEEVVERLEELVNTVKHCLEIPKNKRTAVSNAELKAAIKELIALMRDIKRRNFFIPPMTEADFILLGVHSKDTILTPVGEPDAIPELQVNYDKVGGILLDVKISKKSPKHDPRSIQGVKVFFKVCGHGEEHPTVPGELGSHKFVTGGGEKKIPFKFEQSDRRKSVWFCARFENRKGQSGGWSELVEGIIVSGN